MSCGVGHRHSLDLAWLWLWHRPVAAAPIWPLTWEPPYDMGAASTQLQLGFDPWPGIFQVPQGWLKKGKKFPVSVNALSLYFLSLLILYMWGLALFVFVYLETSSWIKKKKLYFFFSFLNYYYHVLYFFWSFLYTFHIDEIIYIDKCPAFFMCY